MTMKKTQTRQNQPELKTESETRENQPELKAKYSIIQASN
jgi:hypothetical protein